MEGPWNGRKSRSEVEYEYSSNLLPDLNRFKFPFYAEMGKFLLFYLKSYMPINKNFLSDVPT